MVEEQEIIQLMLQETYRPMTLKELQTAFGADIPGEQEAFERVLTALEEEGRVVRTRAERFGLPERLNMVRGRLQGNAKGFGFVIPDAQMPFETDLFIHGNEMNGAMDGDIVLARIQGQEEGRRPEGEIVRILKRGRIQVVGTYTDSKHFGFVVPDDKRLSSDIFIPKSGRNDASHGDKVVVKLMAYPEGSKSAVGDIVEVLGHRDDPGVDILAIIRKHQLPEAFPADVIVEAESVPETISEEEIHSQNRRDLRDRVMVTIDGADAKDLDDAVSVEQLDNGHILLGVHIADVSYYVKEGSALDQEAYARGNSVYLVDRVIPMLPQRLSNGICSLNPQVDRLTMTCDMEIDGEGMVVQHDIYPSVIRTNERMTYDAVKRILVDKDEELIERYKPLVSHFEKMAELAEILRKKRFNRGAIDFDFPEAKIKLDEEGKPVAIVQRPRTVSEMLIEEFMLAANETVAEHFNKLKIPFMYRIHEHPDPEKLQAFFEFITIFGHTAKGSAQKVKPQVLQKILKRVEGKPEEKVISKVMLRSMQQAKYSAECLGHFGLAATYYSHFTSPIRRYPDLIIHRIMREVFEYNGKNLPDKRKAKLTTWLPEAGQHTSDRERVAVDAERDTDDLKKAEFMADKVGDVFEGTISSVTSFGMFVELENTVEGLIHVSTMNDDYYNYDDVTLRMTGERTGKVYNIGDKAMIRVTGVNMEEHKVDFELVSEDDDGFVKPPFRPRPPRPARPTGPSRRHDGNSSGSRPGNSGGNGDRNRKGSSGSRGKGKGKSGGGNKSRRPRNK
ncbi:RNAse R [Marininema mesophilum]|uniref:Ribonuclease R n=1 Tax=Marininema mesophilum TaxID=1048340 RepID=A0A1H2TST7_9BACL|nr:ribonuclease R [Marininema mesophilum]SDW46921.1 RNAse R [Marininema mesophilum]